MSRRYTVTHDGVGHVVEVLGADEIRVDGAILRVEGLADGRCLVTGDDGRRTVVAHAGPAHAPWLFAAGAAWQLDVSPEGARRQRTGQADDEMAAPMPATVVSIAAAPGSRVAAGDAVIVLEAMKMELVVRAPRDGEIAAVHCRVGELVRPGARLVELVP
ncbi:MAG: biotin/lipoyl-containing protein [Vicinamibacterales bacterium]